MSDITYKRKCKNWIESFKEWTMPRSEAPEQFIVWTAIWILAVALRRRVFVGKKYLGSWTCWPYLYVMFVGPPGLRKTTTLGYAIDLLELVPNLPKPPTFVTSTGLVDDILKSPDSSIYLIIEEFSDIMQKTSGAEMYEFLTSMYDGKKNLRQKTMMRGLEHAEKPTINMFAATTPGWIAENIPVASMTGGFASRVNWVYADKLRQKRMYYRKERQTIDFEALGVDLAADLIHIATLEGEFELTEAAMEFMENYYQTMEDKATTLKKYPGYLNRKPVMIHKVAMISKIAQSDELILDVQDFKDAIKLVEMLEANLPKVFHGVGKNEYSLEMKDIVDFVSEAKSVDQKTLYKQFQSAATPARLEELINGLLMAGELETKMENVDGDNVRVFRVCDD